MTVRVWRRGQLPAAARLRLAGGPVVVCSVRGRESHRVPPGDGERYAYLLGVYLGDGCIGVSQRSCCLRISLDRAYPAVVDEVVAAIASVLPGKRAHVADGRNGAYVLVSAYGIAWLCLFPQHGQGPKHGRPIVLAPWQQTLVAAHPGALLRGLIHTDGWRGMNRVRVKGRDYAYPRYQFSSRSADIRGLFTDSCDRLGIAWRPWGRHHISVARREAVAKLDAFVGPKQ